MKCQVKIRTQNEKYRFEDEKHNLKILRLCLQCIFLSVMPYDGTSKADIVIFIYKTKLLNLSWENEYWAMIFNEINGLISLLE